MPRRDDYMPRTGVKNIIGRIDQGWKTIQRSDTTTGGFMRKVAIVIILLVCVGCWPYTTAVPEGVTTGAKLLKKGTEKLGTDYEEFKASLKAYMVEATEDTKKALEEREKVFDRGFDALKLAVDAQCEAIEALSEQKGE